MKEDNCGHPAAILRSDSRCQQAYLIAGGESRRMGRDKLFLPVGNQTLIEQVLGQLAGRFDSVKIVARTTHKFSALPYEVLIDSPTAQGPMAGLIAALEDCREKACFVCAADLPDLSTDLIDRLLKNYNGEDYFGIDESAADTKTSMSNIQPLCGIWAKSALPVLNQLADNGNYRLSDLVEQINAAGISLEGDRWRNLNCPTDLGPGGEING